MSATAVQPVGLVLAAPRLRVSMESVRCAFLWLTGISGAFVFIEPSPYELVSFGAMIIFALGSLSLSAPLVPLALLLVLYNAGFAVTLGQVLDEPKAILWVLVSAFLSATAIFFAAALGTNTHRRLTALMRGYTAAGIIAAVIAIIGYFHLLGGYSDIFLLYERARGTFNDPNVLGAFLVLPALVLFQRVLAARLLRQGFFAGALLLLLLAALFLSFSRGAWGQFGLAAIVLMMLSFLCSRSIGERLRIVLLVCFGLLALASFVVALLSIDQVADLFKERAMLEQSYDSGHSGRFGRHALGMLLALDRPLGIGPMQFHKIFSEDPHNAYLNAFMSGGWLAGVSYLALTAVTLVMSSRFLLTATPWRAAYHVVYASYLGVVAESLIIDSDHWRHYFLLLGVLWGLMAATRRFVSERPAQI